MLLLSPPSILHSPPLSTQKGVTDKVSVFSGTVVDDVVPDSPTAEESLNNNVVEEVLNSLKDIIPAQNVVPDVGTSLAQEKPTSGVVGNATDEENDEPQADVELAGGNAAGEKNTDKSAADNVVSVEEDVVDVDALADLEQTVHEVANGSIARRLRNRKGKEADVVSEVVTTATKSSKKKMVGPTRKPSKVEIPSQKKKSSGKRKQASVGDSDYEGEEDVPHIVSNTVSSSKKKSQKKQRIAASVSDQDVGDDVPNIVLLAHIFTKLKYVLNA
jgi:hypothetical protein